MPDEAKTSPVRTTETSFDVIDALIELDGAQTDELAHRLDLAPSTVHRHLQTLRRRGYVVNVDGNYRISFQFLTIGGLARNRRSEYRMAENYVGKLAAQTNELAHFIAEENGERVFLFRRAGENAIPGKPVGNRGPLHCSGAGKAILAELPDERVAEIIDQHGLAQVTENTITDVDELYSELNEVRKQGFAMNMEESAKGFNAIGVSITDPHDEVIGALSVSGPSNRLNERRLEEEILDIVRGTAHELELKIEY